MSRCITCHGELLEGEVDIHVQCARKLFKLSYMPRCLYTSRRLADEAVRLDPAQKRAAIATIPFDVRGGKEESLAEFEIGKTGSNYTLSVVKSDDSTPTILENLVMKMAAVAHISTAPHTLITTADGSKAHLVDNRVKSSRRVGKSFKSLADLLPKQESYRCEEIAAAVMKASTTPKLDCVNLLEMLYFAWLVGDTQFGVDRLRMVTTKDGFTTLAPIRTATSTTLTEDKVRHETTILINNKRNDLSPAEFEIAMQMCGLESKIAENIVAKFNTLIDPWCDMIEESELSEELKDRLKFMFFLKV